MEEIINKLEHKQLGRQHINFCPYDNEHDDDIYYIGTFNYIIAWDYWEWKENNERKSDTIIRHN